MRKKTAGSVAVIVILLHCLSLVLVMQYAIYNVLFDVKIVSQRAARVLIINRLVTEYHVLDSVAFVATGTYVQSTRDHFL